MGSATNSPELPTLLRTKLHRPPMTADLVPRPRLLERLDQRRQRPLTLVSAGAGYGKTTLVSSWLEANGWPNAWLSLDEDDNDLCVFLTYTLAAVRSIFPQAGESTQALLKSATLPPPPILARSLINELDELETRFVLVLDDYHLIRDTAVHELLNDLLRHPPRPMHLVLASRRDPPLELHKLRARSQVTEIRAEELRFTQEETAAFLEQGLKTRADDVAVEALMKRVEGWAAGLRLITLSLRHRGSVDLSPACLTGSVAYVADYLMAEVLASQPPAIQDFLLKTSILDRLNGPLCDFLTNLDEPECDGRAYLEWLNQENLFTIPLDDQRQWYRYHPLFRNLLQDQLGRKLGADGIAALHKQASAWFAKKGLLEESLHHAVEGGDISGASQLVAHSRHELMNHEQWHRLRRLLGLISRNTFERDPELLMAQAWSLWNQMRLTEMTDVLDQVEPLLAAIPPESAMARELRGELDALRSVQYFLGAPCDGPRALAYAQQAVQKIPRQRHSQRGFAIIILAMAHQMAGDINTAYSVVHNALDEQKAPRTTYHARLLTTLCFMHWVQADLIRLQQTADQLLKLGLELDLPESIGIARYSLGVSHYCCNQPAAAAKNLVVAVNDINIGNIFNFAHSAFALALSYQAQGRPSEAREVGELVVNYSLDTNNVPLLQLARAFQAELALRQGNMAEASHWASTFDPEPFRAAHRFYVPQLTLAKILLAQDTTESRGRAADVLARLHDFFTSIHNTRFLIDVLALGALLNDAQGNQAAALEKLKRAVHLAEPGGWIRLFVDLGPRMAGLLERLHRQGVAPGYIAQVLVSCHNETKDEGLKTKVLDSSFVAPGGPSSVVEPLTARELDVLELLAQRLSNKEIAAQLVISPLTVKKHTVSIYGKLGVKNRRQAVSQAAELGILPQRLSI